MTKQINQSLRLSRLRNNFISLALGQGVLFIINFITILLVARLLGVEEFGEFASLLAIITITSKIIDFGLGPIIFRELSDDDTGLTIFDNVLTLKLILTFIVFIGYNICVFLIELPTKSIILSDLLFLNIIFSSRMANFREVLTTPFKSSMQMHIPMLINIIDNSLLLVYVLVLSGVGLSLEKFIFGYVFFNIPGFVIIIIYLRNKFGYKFHIKLNKVKWLIIEALPLAGYVLLMIIFQQADILLIKNINGSYSTGIYSAATRLTMPLNIIPATIVTSIFPMIVKHRGNEEYSARISLLFKVLFFISFLFAIIFSFKSFSFIHLTFGNSYEESAVPTILLFWAQVFLFFSFLGNDILIAYNSQKWNFLYAVIIVLLNLLLDLILLPKMNFVGAGISKLIASFLGAAIIAVALRSKDVNFYIISFKNLVWMISILIAFYLLSFLPLYLYILSVLISFFVTLRYHLFFKWDEILFFARIFNLKEWSLKLLFSDRRLSE